MECGFGVALGRNMIMSCGRWEAVPFLQILDCQSGLITVGKMSMGKHRIRQQDSSLSDVDVCWKGVGFGYFGVA